ncbi:MAG TPA: hypothetical protein VGB42_12945 [Candidatus Thermoplasmatota archaeon]
MSTVFFDLETLNLFEDVEPQWPAMDWEMRNANQARLCRKLGIAVAGVGVGPDVEFFEEDEAELLVGTLLAADRVVGHNVLAFDYLVMEPYVGEPRVARLKEKTIDMLAALREPTGVRIGLDDLAQLNLGKGKTDDPRMVPTLWRRGERERVRSYLRSDVELTREVFEYGARKGKLRYTRKDWKKGTREVLEVACPWAPAGGR